MCRCSMMQHALGHTFQKTLPPTFPAHDDRMTHAMQQEVLPLLCFNLVGVSHLIVFPKRLYKLRKGTIVQWFLSISLIQLCNTNGPPLSSRVNDTTFTFSCSPQVGVSHLACPLKDCPKRMGSILFTLLYNYQQPWPANHGPSLSQQIRGHGPKKVLPSGVAAKWACHNCITQQSAPNEVLCKEGYHNKVQMVSKYFTHPATQHEQPIPFPADKMTVQPQRVLPSGGRATKPGGRYTSAGVLMHVKPTRYRHLLHSPKSLVRCLQMCTF